MKISKYVILSLVLSFALHLILMYSLSEVAITPPLAKLTPYEDTTMPVAINLEEIIKPQDVQKPKPREDGKLSQEKTTPEGVSSPKELVKQAYVEKSVNNVLEKDKLTVPMPKPKVQFGGLNMGTLKPDLPAPRAEIHASAPRPKIIEIDAASLMPAARVNRRLTPKVERIDVPTVKLPSLLPPGPVVKGEGASYNVNMKFTQPSFGGPGVIPEDAPPSTPGNVVDSLNNTLVPRIPELLSTDSILSKNTPTVSFEEFVDMSIVIKDDPLTGGGFFMASISANEKCDAVREIPKDVIIIIDRSSSISPNKFQAFKTSAIRALESLNPHDYFNIGSFTDKPFSMSRTFLPATPSNKSAAQQFINKLMRGGTTSVFAGLRPFVQLQPQSPGRPLNIFLLTDGISTVNIYNDDDFLRTITGINPGHVSIFTFSAGKDANRDLLDFLSFLNRGNSFHARTADGTKSNLTNFITNHSSLLIRDLEYLAPQNLIGEIYPKKLQHLYRGSDVKLYGKYSATDTEIIFKVVGYDADGTRRDVIFRKPLAECQHTNEDLASGWAAKKIIHLLADKTISINQAEKRIYENEIRKLSSIYGLAIPY